MQTPFKREDINDYYLRWGPFICALVAFMLILVDLTRHVFVDLGGSEFRWMAMYNDDVSLTSIGLACLMLNWAGVALFVFGFAWFNDAPTRLKQLYAMWFHTAEA